MIFIKGKISNILTLILMFALVLVFVPFDFYKFENNIDNSWAMALNLAIKNNFVFGKDIIFTYGPLGHLMTGLAFYVSNFNIYIFRLFLIFNSFYFIIYSYNYFSIHYIFIIPFLAIVNFLFSSHIDLLLFFFFLFQLFLYSTSNKKINLFILLLISITSLYIKLNTGIIINILFLFSIFYFKKPRYILIFFGFILTHFILIKFLKIDFISYLLNGFEMINYYNDAMYIPSKIRSLILALIIIFIFIIFVILGIFRGIFYEKKFIKFHLLLNLIFLFILFKQSFVRADLGHTQIFFLGSAYLFVLQSLYIKNDKLNKILIYVYAIIVSIIILFLFNKKYDIKNFFINNINFLYPNENTNNNFLRSSSNDILPDRFLQLLKNNSVDIFPTDINIIYFNNLNYNPRPIIQSYSAYSDKFLRINGDKYNSEQSPDFIIYHDGVKIDKQHPFWQDSYAELAMIQNYDLIDSFIFNKNKKIFLLKKNNRNLLFKKKLISETILSTNTSLLIPKSDNMIFMECEIEYTITGKFVRFLYQPSPLNIKLVNSKNESNILKGVIPLLESGILVNKDLLNNNGSFNSNALLNLFNNKENTIKIYNKELKFIANSKYIKNNIKVKFYEYSL